MGDIRQSRFETALFGCGRLGLFPQAEDHFVDLAGQKGQLAFFIRDEIRPKAFVQQPIQQGAELPHTAIAFLQKEEEGQQQSQTDQQHIAGSSRGKEEPAPCSQGGKR